MRSHPYAVAAVAALLGGAALCHAQRAVPVWAEEPPPAIVVPPEGVAVPAAPAPQPRAVMPVPSAGRRVPPQERFVTPRESVVPSREQLVREGEGIEAGGAGRAVWHGLVRAWELLIENRLEVGVRSTTFHLDESQRGVRVGPGDYEGTFIGSINSLEEDQDTGLDRFFIQYKLVPWVGIGVTTDRIRVSTRDDGMQPENTDGEIEAETTMPYILVAVPNLKWVQPFAEFGYGKVTYSVDFTESEGWSDDGVRSMDVTDVEATFVSIGCDVRLWDHLYINLYRREVDADSSFVQFHKNGELLLTGDYPLSHTATGIGLKYAF